MKPIYAHAAGAVALTFAIAACVPAPDSTPAPTATPAATIPAPTPTPTPAAPTYDSWVDAPQTAGTWTYSREEVGPTRRLYTSAAFNDPKGETLLRMTCSPSGNFLFGRYIRSVGDAALIVRTETATRTLVAPRDPEGQVLNTAVMRPNDPLLDAIALTRGRFAVEAAGHPTLYLPAWAEVTRVIEDCR